MTRLSSIESKCIKCIKAPYRVLCKARDFYVRRMVDCSGGVSYGGNYMGYPSSAASSLPRSYSVSSSSRMSDVDEDLRELMRAASQRDQRNKIIDDVKTQEFSRSRTTTSRTKSSSKNKPPLPRSFTVGIGRIDEEKPCEFDESIKVMKTDGFYPRSNTYASTKRNGVVA